MLTDNDKGATVLFQLSAFFFFSTLTYLAFCGCKVLHIKLIINDSRLYFFLSFYSSEWHH